MAAPPSASAKHVWPVLVADLADADARDFLEGIALARGRTSLPLMTAPGNVTTHMLEVYTPGATEPLVLFALPLGAPTSEGFPLQLRMFDPGEAPGEPAPPSARSGLRPATRNTTGELRAKNPTNHQLTKRHTQDLSGQVADIEPEALLGRTLAGGKLQIESMIGKGGVGVVYRATHRDLRIRLAVKVLSARFQHDIEFCRRFHAEALAASRLDHTNLMRVLDFGQEPDGMLYLAMEFLDGKNLAEAMEEGQPFPLRRLFQIMIQVCTGLSHAHSRGIVHRDMKPENVVLVANRDDDERPDELVKVCDFGIAVAEGDLSARVIGTPDYMSPEQCQGVPLDGRSDVYSCGVMLYELATGKLPFFGAESAQVILHHHVHELPPPPRDIQPDVPVALEAIIMKALAKDPAHRQATIRELRNELRTLAQAEAITLAPSSRERPVPSPAASFGPEPPSDAGVNGPEWLQRSGYRHESSAELAVGDVQGALLAAELSAKPASWLATFASTMQRHQFDTMANQLELAIPRLMRENKIRTLFAVRTILDVISAEDAVEPHWRVARATSMQHAFADPGFLAVLAEAVLSTDRPPREVTELLLRVGPPGAYALYSCRLKMTNYEGVRKRYVVAIRAFGESALPMIRAGLARLGPRRELVVAAAMAADLFEASPRVRDDGAGEVTAPYIQGSPPELTCLAAKALVAFWGERATPLLVGLLGSDVDEVRVAAINGVRELRAVDEYLVMKILSAARSTSSAEVHSAARAAFLDTIGNPRVVAERALAELGSP